MLPTSVPSNRQVNISGIPILRSFKTWLSRCASLWPKITYTQIHPPSLGLDSRQSIKGRPPKRGGVLGANFEHEVSKREFHSLLGIEYGFREKKLRAVKWSV
jgi:hypothetical protein